MQASLPTRPNWPAWYGFAALLLGLFIALVATVFLAGIFGSGAHGHLPSGVALAVGLVQEVAFLTSALFFAAQVKRPEPQQFGIRPASIKRAALWMLIAGAGYYVVSRIYIVAINPHVHQSTLKDLGADHGGLVTVIIGILVVGLAPPAEEFFFRGFMYGALRNRFSFLAAASLDGLVFGGVHVTTGASAVPPLIAFGFALCMLYEATGSILPGIVLHSLNNMAAFASDKDGSWAVGIAVSAAVLLACVTLPGRSRNLKLNATGGA